MSATSFDCTSCGACCFSRNPHYLILLPEDASRAIPPDILVADGDRRFMRFDEGHCSQLCETGDGRMTCQIYEDRPEACRAFRSGSFECLKARRANGLLGARVRPVRERDGELEPA